MRRHGAFQLIVLTLALVSWAQTKKADPVGYIYCASDKPEQLVPVFLEHCMKVRVGTFSCGHKMQVVAQMGSTLKVLTSAGSTVYVSSDVVSQKADEPIPVEIEAGAAPDCEVKVVERDPTKNRGPRVVFQREPDYPEHARRTRDERTVSIGLVVGVDGQPHDIKVEASPGRDFSKSAVEAVRQWRFEPALKDGQSVEMPIHVEMAFRLVY
jgi:TonB family protein